MIKNLLLLAMGLALTTQMIMAQVPSYVPTNGLIGFYSFNGNANDESGNAHNGTVIGATLTSDRFGNANSAYSFNGVNNKITLANSTNIINDSFSISSWVTIENLLPSNYDVIVIGQANGTTVGSQKWQVGYRGILQQKGMSLYVYDNAGSGNGSGEDILWTPTASIWYHVTWVFSAGNNIKIYINGVLQYTINSTTTVLNNLRNDILTEIGVGHDEILPLYWKGKIDDIGIWNRVLTQDEITSLYYSENSCKSMVINTGILGFNPIAYNNTVTIYPNPANDHITIDCGNIANVSGWTIKIINTLGQEVFNGAMNTQQYVVPLNTWSGQGIYFVKIYDSSNNLMNTKKIILQ